MENPTNFVRDPTSNQFSASRLGMLLMVFMMVVLDINSIYLMLYGGFMKEWFAPLATMNSATVGSLALVYASNSATGAFGAWKNKIFGSNGCTIEEKSVHLENLGKEVM
jgi:hypothetical protein